MKIDKNHLIFSDGSTVYAHRGIVGIGPSGDLYSGYDGYLDIDTDHALTKEQRIELADYMISEWMGVKARAMDE